MPLRAEIILSRVSGICRWGFALAILTNLLLTQAAQHWRPHGYYRDLLLLGMLLSVVCVVCLVLWIATSAVLWFLRRNKRAGVGSAQATIRQDAASFPEIAAAFRSDSILSLSWAINYNTGVRLAIKQLLIKSSFWLPCFFMGVLFTFLLAPSFGYNSLVGQILAFLIGGLVSAAITFGQVAWNLRQSYPAHAPVQHQGLIVDPTGVRSVIGNKQYSYPWSAIGKVQELRGTIFYRRKGVLCLIPDFAFESRRDAKAFVATINALKEDLPAPPYDWSDYIPVDPKADGVWPPAIR